MINLDSLTDQHTQTLKLSSHELVRRLNKDLGTTLVATLAGVKDRKLPYKWAESDGPIPRDEAYRRLQAAHRVWQMINDADNDYLARAWFIGANPRLGEESPVIRLREGDLAGVISAAKAFVEGLDD